MKPAPIPAALKFGSVTARVFKTRDGRVGFSYKAGSKWKYVIRSSVVKLREDFERIALALLNAETAAIDFTAERRRIAITAHEILAPLGLQLDAAAREVVEAHRISGGVSLRDLALFHKRNFTSLPVEKTVHECVDQVLAQIEERNLSSRYLRDMKNDGKRIKGWLKGRTIGDVLQEEILALIRDHQKEKKFGWKRRNHLRNAFVYIWSKTQEMGWLPQGRDTAAARVPLIEEPLSWSAVHTFTSEEMRFWIAKIQERYLPWLLVCGFSMVRSEEVAPPSATTKDRLRWSDFNWAKKYIRIRREVSKTGRKKPEPRNVPMPDNLIAWLEPWRDATGFVCDVREQPSKRETSRLSAVAEKKKLPFRWKQNALRHTSISVGLGRSHDRARVAEEAGTSEAKIHKNYNEGFDEDQVREWDSIMPDASYSANILPLWRYSAAAQNVVNRSKNLSSKTPSAAVDTFLARTVIELARRDGAVSRKN